MSLFVKIKQNTLKGILLVLLSKCEYDEKFFHLFIIENNTKMQPGGQSIVDRLLATKNTILGQNIAKVACKATTEEIMGPKRKHLDCKF